MKLCKGLMLPALAVLLAGVILGARLGPSASAGVPSTEGIPTETRKGEAVAAEGDAVTVNTWRETTSNVWTVIRNQKHTTK